MVFNQQGGSKTDTIVKLVLVFFISLLSFSVGTFVGKQFSDSQHRLASLENEYNKDFSQGRSTASIPGDSMGVEPNEILSSDDVAKLAEEFVQVEKSSDEIARNVANTETKKPTEAKVDLTQKAANKIATGNAPLEAVKPAQKPASAPVLPSTVAADIKGKYTIQVSSHQSETDAKGQVSKLTTKGFVASYTSADVSGKTWYRVGVGSFGTVKSAKEYLEKIKANPEFKGAIVRQIVQ